MQKALQLIANSKQKTIPSLMLLIFVSALLLASIIFFFVESLNIYILVLSFTLGYSCYLSYDWYKFKVEYNNDMDRIVKALQKDRKEGLKVLEGYCSYLKSVIANRINSSHFGSKLTESSYVKMRRIMIITEKSHTLDYAKDFVTEELKANYLK